MIWFLHFMVFNATINNISAISWRSDLLVEEAVNDMQHLLILKVLSKPDI